MPVPILNRFLPLLRTAIYDPHNQVISKICVAPRQGRPHKTTEGREFAPFLKNRQSQERRKAS